ncbi:hypothetical protein F0562_028328 [Nyssa sinensis]|uniref:Uncharacterized protein n=1 Tax=Nyssa sinensis TaxID=561372 RepID=A0A5J5BBT6_9ASTE|nr:hypothetical protein F0562_028328 [Nyssa sinensis]
MYERLNWGSALALPIISEKQPKSLLLSRIRVNSESFRILARHVFGKVGRVKSRSDDVSASQILTTKLELGGDEATGDKAIGDITEEKTYADDDDSTDDAYLPLPEKTIKGVVITIEEETKMDAKDQPIGRAAKASEVKEGQVVGAKTEKVA